MPKSLIHRVTRLVAGVTHNSLEQAEQAAAVPVMEQAIREIDAAVKEVRGEIGQYEATKHNVSRRLSDLESEHHDLAGKIALAVRESAEDLAEAGIGRQLDIETQRAVLERSLLEADEDIAKLSESLAALQACRREARDRLRDLKAAPPHGGNGGIGAIGGIGGSGATAKATEAIESAQHLGESLTGVPADVVISSKDLDNLADLHRRHAIRERLAEHKARTNQAD